MRKISDFFKSLGGAKATDPMDKEGWPPLPKVTPPCPLPPPRLESGARFTVPSQSTSVGARCLCCNSNNVTLHDNGPARWVQCHNPPCGMSHYVSMHPELARFFPQRESATWPQHCHLCNHEMESDTDRAEWHGLGNCVPICPTCSGSGTAEEIARMLPPETVFEAARQLIQKRAELIELQKRIDDHDHEEFSSCDECDSWPVKNSEYKSFCEQWAHQFALFAGGMRTSARGLTIVCSGCGKETTIKWVRDKDAQATAEGGCATQANPEQLYSITSTGDGAETIIVGESQLHEELHRVFCACGKPWQECDEDEGRMKRTIETLDDNDAWTHEYPNYLRHIWQDHGEDYTVTVARVTTRA